MAVRFSTAEVSRRSQLDYWREVVCATFFALDVERGGLARTGFRGEITAQSLGQLRIATVSSEPHAVIRSAEKIRGSYDDDFVVNLAVRGHVMMTQQRFDAVLQPGDFAVYDSALPCRIACPDPFRQIVLKIPRDMYTAHCLLPGRRQARGAVVAITAWARCSQKKKKKKKKKKKTSPPRWASGSAPTWSSCWPPRSAR